VADAWAQEAQRLMQLPRPFDGFVEYAKRVSPTCLVYLERNRYSVPASFANRPVSVRVYPERIVVAAEGQVVCEHRRVFARSHQRKSTTTVFDWRHYLAVIQRKPGALRNGAPFAELPPAFRTLQQRMLNSQGKSTAKASKRAISSLSDRMDGHDPSSRILPRYLQRKCRRPGICSMLGRDLGKIAAIGR